METKDPIGVIGRIAAVFAGLSEVFKRAVTALKNLRFLKSGEFKGSRTIDALKSLRFGGKKKVLEPVKISKHLGSNNHNVSVSKIRVNMAKESNRINRKRIKGWHH